MPTLDDVIRANQAHLLSLEKKAIKELKDYLSRTRLPVNISFSGGKDSLAAAILALKVKPRAEMLFINTQLEFPETLQYVREFCRTHKLRLHEIVGKSSFFEQVQSFGPPAKDFRWCCKTNKLGPMTSFIQAHYPRGCVTIEGRRIYESFNRAKIGFVERNPYVPNQTTLLPPSGTGGRWRSCSTSATTGLSPIRFMIWTSSASAAGCARHSCNRSSPD